MNPAGAVVWILPAGGILLSAVFFLASMRRGGFSLARSAAGFLLGLLLSFLFSKGLYVLLNYASLQSFGAGKWFRLVPEEFSFAAGGIGFCLGTLAVWTGRPGAPAAAADRLAFPGCLLAACLRFGEIFHGELGLADVSSMGLPDLESGALFARFPFAVQDAWGYWYPSVSTVSALLILLVGVYALVMRKKQDHASGLPGGMVFESCAFLLCALRFFLELTRMKSLIFYFVHVDQVLCALVMAALMIWAGLRGRHGGGRFPVVCFVLFLLCIALNGVTQYLMDKPWQFESLLPESAFSWISDNLAPFSFSLLLLTSVLPVVLYFLLLRKVRSVPGGNG